MSETVERTKPNGDFGLNDALAPDKRAPWGGSVNGFREAVGKIEQCGIDQICHAISAGFTLSAIAAFLGVSTYAMRVWLVEEPVRSTRAHEARRHAAWAYDEEAQHRLEAARDAHELAIAKEIATHFRWRASKVNPKLYGDKLEATITFQSGLADRLSAAMSRSVGRTIDVEPEQEAIEAPLEVVPHAD